MTLFPLSPTYGTVQRLRGALLRDGFKSRGEGNGQSLDDNEQIMFCEAELFMRRDADSSVASAWLSWEPDHTLLYHKPRLSVSLSYKGEGGKTLYACFDEDGIPLDEVAERVHARLFH